MVDISKVDVVIKLLADVVVGEFIDVKVDKMILLVVEVILAAVETDMSGETVEVEKTMPL